MSGQSKSEHGHAIPPLSGEEVEVVARLIQSTGLLIKSVNRDSRTFVLYVPPPKA